MKYIKQSCIFLITLLFIVLVHYSSLRSLTKMDTLKKSIVSPFIDFKRREGFSKLIPLGNIVLFCMVSNAAVVSCFAIIGGSKRDSVYFHLKKKLYDLPLIEDMLVSQGGSAYFNDPLDDLSLLGNTVAMVNVYGNPFLFLWTLYDKLCDDRYKEDQLIYYQNLVKRIETTFPLLKKINNIFRTIITGEQQQRESWWF